MGGEGVGISKDNSLKTKKSATEKSAADYEKILLLSWIG